MFSVEKNMYVYLFTVLVGWILWKICTGLLSWWRMRLSVRPIPLVTDNHWFFGLFHKIGSLGDLIRHCQPFLESRPTKWFRTTFLFLHPILYPVHPDTLRPILSASGVPKNLNKIGGVYRLFLPWIGDGLLVSNGLKWERNRRLLTPAFHFDILKPYVDIVGEVTDIFLNNLEKLSDNCKHSVDVFPMVSRLTLHNMLRCTLSYEDDSVQETRDQHPYVRAVNRLKYLVVARIVNPFYLSDWIFDRSKIGKEFKMHCDFIHEFSEKIIEARKQALKKDKALLEKRHLDFLDILLTARDSDGSKLTDGEIRDEVDTFMFEGHDTTASAISWAIHSLAKYPEYQDQVRKEVAQVLNGKKQPSVEDISKLSFTTCFIKESMRKNTPIPAITRILEEPITIEGVHLMKGQPVDIYIHMLHHNPLVWENHTEFHPSRFFPENLEGKDPFTFLPFSAGQRNCIGQHFAMNEIKVVISKLVQRFEVRLDPEREAEQFPEVIMGAKNGIYLYFKELN